MIENVYLCTLTILEQELRIPTLQSPSRILMPLKGLLNSAATAKDCHPKLAEITFSVFKVLQLTGEPILETAVSRLFATLLRLRTAIDIASELLTHEDELDYVLLFLLFVFRKGLAKSDCAPFFVAFFECIPKSLMTLEAVPDWIQGLLDYTSLLEPQVFLLVESDILKYLFHSNILVRTTTAEFFGAVIRNATIEGQERFMLLIQDLLKRFEYILESPISSVTLSVLQQLRYALHVMVGGGLSGKLRELLLSQLLASRPFGWKLFVLDIYPVTASPSTTSLVSSMLPELLASMMTQTLEGLLSVRVLGMFCNKLDKEHQKMVVSCVLKLTQMPKSIQFDLEVIPLYAQFVCFIQQIQPPAVSFLLHHMAYQRQIFNKIFRDRIELGSSGHYFCAQFLATVLPMLVEPAFLKKWSELATHLLGLTNDPLVHCLIAIALDDAQLANPELDVPSMIPGHYGSILSLNLVSLKEDIKESLLAHDAEIIQRVRFDEDPIQMISKIQTQLAFLHSKTMSSSVSDLFYQVRSKLKEVILANKSNLVE